MYTLNCNVVFCCLLDYSMFIFIPFSFFRSLQQLHGQHKALTGINNADERCQPDVHKHSAKHRPQRPICHH